MSRLSNIIVVVALLLGTGLFLDMGIAAKANKRRAKAQTQARPIKRTSQAINPHTDGFEPQILATNRISIPFGIEPTLPLDIDGQTVLVRGHGGCTEDELVTVAITLTHSTSYNQARGEQVEICTGDLQHWHLDVSTDSSMPLTAGSAEACGLATTRADGEVTDSYAWCREVNLSWQNLLPVITH